MVLSKQISTTISMTYWLWQGNLPPLQLAKIKKHTNQTADNSIIDYNIWISPQQQVLQTTIPEKLSATAQQEIIKNTFQIDDAELQNLHWQNFLWNSCLYTIGIEIELLQFLEEQKDIHNKKDKKHKNTEIHIPWLCWCDYQNTVLKKTLGKTSNIYEQTQSDFLAIFDKNHYRLIAKENYQKTKEYWQTKIDTNEFKKIFCEEFQIEASNVLKNITSVSFANLKVMPRITVKKALFQEKSKIKMLVNSVVRTDYIFEKTWTKFYIFLDFLYESWLKKLIKPLLTLLVCNIILLLFLRNNLDITTQNKISPNAKTVKSTTLIYVLLQQLQENNQLNLQEIQKISCDEVQKECTLFFSNNEDLNHYQQKINNTLVDIKVNFSIFPH